MAYTMLQLFIMPRLSPQTYQAAFYSEVVHTYVIVVDRWMVCPDYDYREPSYEKLTDMLKQLVDKEYRDDVAADYKSATNYNYCAPYQFIVHHTASKQNSVTYYKPPENMKPAVFSRRSLRPRNPPGILYQQDKNEEAKFWKDKLTMSFGNFPGEITERERGFLKSIGQSVRKDPIHKNIVTDRDGNDFTEVFSKNPAAPQAEAIHSHIMHLFQSRPLNGTVFLVWDWADEYDDLVNRGYPGPIIIDFAYAIPTRLYRKYPDQQTKHGAEAQFDDGDFFNAAALSRSCYEIPDFEELYASIMSAPTRDISKEELLHQLQTEPSHLRATRLYDYYRFVIEFLRIHQLQLIRITDWDMNTLQLSELFRKTLRFGKKTSRPQTFYRRMHAEMSNAFLVWDESARDPSLDGNTMKKYYDAAMVLDQGEARTL